jgi:hypothetical protein
MADRHPTRKTWPWLVLAAAVIACAGVADWVMSRSMTCREFEDILESDARTQTQIQEAVAAENGDGWAFDYRIGHAERVESIRRRPGEVHWLRENTQLPEKPRLQTFGAYHYPWSEISDGGHDIYTVIFDEDDRAIGYLRYEFD